MEAFYRYTLTLIALVYAAGYYERPKKRQVLKYERPGNYIKVYTKESIIDYVDKKTEVPYLKVIQ
jgi:hypothetical protein